MFQRLIGSAVALLVLGPGVVPAQAQPTNNECDLLGEAPDVIVGSLHQKRRHGQSNGITAFSIGTTSCNIGTCGLSWIDNTVAHPVIGQNMFRYKDGRFEQIGQSWLKHGFFALSETLCSADCIGTDGTSLGVNCSDPYTAFLNGQQGGLGPKFEVNAATGEFLYPFTGEGQAGDIIFKRLQVHNEDLNPALNPGAAYYVEGQYVTADDAQAGNATNNASYRAITVSGAGTIFDITLQAQTSRGSPAINAWPRNQLGVIVRAVDITNDGRILIGSFATDNGDGTWNYEYAVQNLTSQRSASSFTVPLPPGATVTDIGFHDVDYHSGEPYDGTDWAAEVSAGSIVWSVAETFQENPNANALRWGTLYNFRFVTDVPPNADAVIVVGLFHPGTPSELVHQGILAPLVCDGDGICEPGETCSNCAGDCVTPGGKGGDACCGDGFCDPIESSCTCQADCGVPLAQEFACTNGVDDDCDGLTDCSDGDCCADGACETGIDNDGDTVANCDCDDGNSTVWERPGEVRILLLDRGPSGTDLSWLSPRNLGSDAVTYSTLRSTVAADFVNAGFCLPSGNPLQTVNVDSETPATNEAFFYLIRAENNCPGVEGDGDLGVGPGGFPREGLSCP